MVRKIRAKLVLELRAQGFSARAISIGQGISHNTVAKIFHAADRLNMTSDDITESSEHDVYERLFPGRGERQSVYAQPNWPTVHKDLARVGVRLKLLHAEYVDGHANDDQPVMDYDRFCRGPTNNACSNPELP